MSTPKPIPFGVRTFEKLGEVLCTYSHEAFTLFVACAACALSAGQREADYLQLVAPYKPSQIQAIAETFGDFICAADRQPFREILGPVHMELGNHKEFFGNLLLASGRTVAEEHPIDAVALKGRIGVLALGGGQS